MKLSILIAAYNVAEFIEKCILSCYDERQAASYEIIVINDGSTDETTQTVERLKKTVPNLTLVNKHNGGLGAARNTGLQHSQGQYVWMIDGDDFLSANAVKEVLSNLSSRLDVYAYNFNITNENGVVLSQKYNDGFPKKVMTGSQYYARNFESSYTAQFIFRRELFTANDIRFLDRINMQDSEILPRLMYYTKSIIYKNFAVYNYVQHAGSFTNTTDSNKRLRYFESIITVDHSLQKFVEGVGSDDTLLCNTVALKRATLHQIVFNHLVFFPYSAKTFRKVINLLQKNNFYPLKAKQKGKLTIVFVSMNLMPLLTTRVLELIRR